MTNPTRLIGETVHLTIDRPLGSSHPKGGWSYPVNYGFVPGTESGDGEALDAYVLGVDSPLSRFTGQCIAVIRREEEDDPKLVVVPEGETLTDEQILAATRFQEVYFTSKVVRAAG